MSRPIICARCGRTIPLGDAWEKTTEDEKVCAAGQCRPPTLYDRIRPYGNGPRRKERENDGHINANWQDTVLYAARMRRLTNQNV